MRAAVLFPEYARNPWLVVAFLIGKHRARKQGRTPIMTSSSDRLAPRKYGSDHIVDLLRHYEIPYAAFNPGASFRGIHDSLVNHLGDQTPSILECTHEEISVAIAHGYARASGKPMVALLHDVVGLQHATMAIYNAWCDRIPAILLGGTGPMSYASRRPGSDWVHTALVQGNLVRDFVKWDDQPADLASVGESFARAHQAATSEPCGPVYVCLDAAIQEQEVHAFPALPDRVRLKPASAPTASPDVVERIARMLAEARSPVVVADRMGRSATAFTALVELAQLLACPVIDQGNRHNFPTSHDLCANGYAEEALDAADVVLGLDVLDFYGALHTVDRVTRATQPIVQPGTPLVHVTLDGYALRSWSHDFRQLQPVDELVAADTAVFLPQLVSACRDAISTRAGSAREQRRERWSARTHDVQRAWHAQAERERAQSPIALSSVALAVWDAIRREDWVLAHGTANGWARRLWDIDCHDRYAGKNTGGGLGYGLQAALGVALAHPDRLCVDLQTDGDFLFTSTALWTAAHHSIQLLIVLVNNRSYFNSEEHAQRIARHRERSLERTPVGTRIEHPAVDFAGMARSMGAHAEGPVADDAALRSALARAVQVVRH